MYIIHIPHRKGLELDHVIVLSIHLRTSQHLFAWDKCWALSKRCGKKQLLGISQDFLMGLMKVIKYALQLASS